MARLLKRDKRGVPNKTRSSGMPCVSATESHISIEIGDHVLIMQDAEFEQLILEARVRQLERTL